MNEEHFTLHLQDKHSRTSANGKYEELSCPQNSENVLPHSISSIENAASQSSRENVTPSSDTSPFASPPLGLAHILLNNVTSIAFLLSCSVESPDSSRAVALYVRRKRIMGKFNSLSPIH